MKSPGRQVGLNNLRDSTIRHSSDRAFSASARNDGVKVSFHHLLNPQALRYLLALSIAFTLLIASISALRTTHAQSPDGATPRAATDVRPIQIDRGAAGLWQTPLKLHN